MKKFLPLVCSSFLFSACLIGGSLSIKSVKAEELKTYIEMNEEFFTDWDSNAGEFASKDARFWGEGFSFEALDTFYRGEISEGWTGSLTSITWKQATQYIYFQWGGANNSDDNVKLIFHYGEYSSEMFNDTFVENPMLLRYFKIPNEQYASLLESDRSGFDMYIEFIDNRTNDYGFHNFGYLHVNQSEEQVSDAMRYYLNNLSHDNREWEVNKRKQILENYYLNDSLKTLFLRVVDNVNEDFEDNDEFLNHWYFDYSYYNNNNWDLHFDKLIGHDNYRPESSTNMPFNNTNGYFRGWYENDELGGFVNGDGPIYRFLSRPFILNNQGIVSVKMSGRSASLHVIDAITREDLAWADLRTFSGEGDADRKSVV